MVDGGNIMNELTTYGLGAATFLTSFTAMTVAEDQWTGLWISIISTLFFSFCNIGVKILTSVLENKGIINHEHKEQLDDMIDDVTDDGKLNDSNK